MGQEISVEAALAAFRQRCSELGDENVLLKAQASELEATVRGLSEENQQLREQVSLAGAGARQEQPKPFVSVDEPG